MANNIFKLSGILKVAVLTADPAGGAEGSIYYNSSTGKFRMYDASGWSNTAIGNLSLTGQPLTTSNIIVGDGSSLSAAVDTSSTGDATVTFGAGIVINASAIVTAKIADGAVTTVKIADANVTNAKLAANSVTTSNITDANVTTGKLADAAVTTVKILDANVTLAKMAANSVDTGNILDNAVSSAKVQSNAITTVKIADANITTAKILDANVTTSKIADGNVTNAKLTGSANTFKGALSDAVPTDLTPTEATSLLNDFVGDSGSGGTKGLVPAPSTGDAAAGKFLSASGVFAVPTGAGDLSGPSSATANGIPRFNGTTGKLVKDSLATIDDSGNISAVGENLSSLTASTALVADASKNIISSATTATEIGYVHGVTSAIQTQIDSKLATSTAASTYIPLTQKGANSGVATLDSGGKIPAAQLPNTVMEYQGSWAPATNAPTLTDGTGNAGDVYRVSAASATTTGTFSDPSMTGFQLGDLVMYSGSVWQRCPAADGVISVNGFQGAVTLTTDNVAEGTTNKYFLDTRAQTAAVVNSLAGSQTVQAPSVAATNTALAAKLSSVSQDTAPQLGGDLDLNGKSVKGILKHSTATAAQFFEEETIWNQTLAGSSSAVTLAALTIATATYQAMEFTYTAKEATTNQVRMGTLRIVTNGTDIGLSDNFADSADIGLSWNASISGGNLIVQYTTGSNAKTVKGVVRRILV